MAQPKKPEGYDPSAYEPFAFTVDLTIFTLREGVLQVLLVERGGEPYQGYWALPGGFVGAREDSDSAALRELREETGLDLSKPSSPGGYLEQLKTYSAPDRDPRMRVVSTAYLAFAPVLSTVQAGDDAADARWWPVEDLLGESPEVELAFDHRLILADALERVRSKLEYTTLATHFVEEPFTLSDLRRVYGAVWGFEPLLANFRRKVLSVEGFVVATEGKEQGKAGPQARLYRRGPAQFMYPPMMRHRLEED